MPRRSAHLAREGEPKQTTPKGLEIPVITEGEFFNAPALASLGKYGEPRPTP